MGPALGIDFGTTNTVIAAATPEGGVELMRFRHEGEAFAAFRSVLSFQVGDREGGPRRVEAGPWAIEAYLEAPSETRFIQSFKSYAASSIFRETRILGRRFSFEDLLSAFLLRLRAHGGLPEGRMRAIVGRPVSFAGLQPDGTLALERYRTGFERLGFAEIRFAFEPVAAAFFFARRLAADATVLVGDFGGGTSDFSIVRFERHRGEIRARPLANAGVGLAGDAFDFRILDNLVSPFLGKGSAYKAFDKILPVPNRYYAAFARWEQLALMRQGHDMAEIRGLMRTALQPEKIERFVEILEGDFGYPLYRAVSQLKESLSDAEEARFGFATPSFSLERRLTRQRFEAWIAPELAAMDEAVGRALLEAGLDEAGIDRVFLTGGSSFVPAVRALFARRFGEARLETGGELVSIASGLAWMGLEPDLDVWTAA